MTPEEQRRYDTLLEIARLAEHVGMITHRFNIRVLPRQAIGGLSLERSEIIVQQWHVAMQALLDSFAGVNLQDPETLLYADDPMRKSLLAKAAGGNRLRINLRHRR